MTFPTTVDILGRCYTIEYDEAMADLGECNQDNLKIRIKPSQPLYLETDTVLHEIMHGIEIGMQLNMTERQIYCITSGLMAVFKNNKELLSYISKAL